VEDLPADPTALVAAPIAGRPVTRSADDPPQLLGVEMDEAAGLGMLVADDRDTLARPAHQTVAAEDPVDRRGRQPDQHRDPVGAPAETSAQGDDPCFLDDREPVRAGVRSGAPVDERIPACRPPAGRPAVVEAAADPSRETRRGDRHARFDELEDGRPTPWRQPSVGVTMHRGALPVIEVVSALNLAGEGLLVVTNLVREQS
jgi:hypothetical protein